MSDRIDRRTFLARGAATTAGIAAIGGSGGILAACGSGSGSGSGSGHQGTHPNGVTSATPKRGGKLVFGVEAEEKGFNPTTATFDATGVLYARTVFDPLAIVGADGSVQPYLAESITRNGDGTVWTITLRPNVVFHDGTPFDAAALVTNFKAQQKALLTGPALTNIAAVAVTGPLSVTVTMHRPWVPFGYYLCGGIGGQIAYPVAPSMLADPNGTTHPVGTGPFVFSEWVQNDHFTATRNPHYWRPGLPYLDTIEYRPITDSQQIFQSLQTGVIDIMHTSTPSVTGQLQALASYGYVDDSKNIVGEPDMACVLLNLSKPPFDDIRVRQAAAAAVSSAEYVKVIGKGLVPTSNGPFVPGTPYYGSTGYPAYDPARARSLLAEVGHPVSFTLNHVPDPSTTQIAQFLQSQFKTVGIDVQLNPIQQAQLINTALTGGFQAQVWRQFSAVNPDLNYIFWSPTQINPVFSINMARNTDPAMEAALQKGRRATDPASAAAAYQEVGSLMGKDIPYLWTARTVWAIGAQPKVQNFNNPTTPAGTPAFGMISGTVWPTQIWLE